MIVGIDISKKWFDAAWQEGGQGRHQRFEYTDAGMGQMLAQTPETAHYVMEATGTSMCVLHSSCMNPDGE